MQTDVDAETVQVRYEDVLQQYLENDPTLSVGDIPSIADLSVDYATDMEVIPKTKEQLVSELTPKISKPGITPGRATIEAQRLYADAERIFGSNADAVLGMYESGQEPRKFFDGVKTAYLSGKMGSRAALENSTAAALDAERGRNLPKGTGNPSPTHCRDGKMVAAWGELWYDDSKQIGRCPKKKGGIRL